MVTPTIEAIRAKATAIYMHEEYNATKETPSTPEDYELKESGYWMRAQHELMRGPDTLKIKEMFSHRRSENRLAPVSKEDSINDQHIKLVMALAQLKQRSAEDLITATYAQKWGQAMQQVHNLRQVYTLEWQMKMRREKR